MLTDISVPVMLFTVSDDNLEESIELLVLLLQQFNNIKELIGISFLWSS